MDDDTGQPIHGYFTSTYEKCKLHYRKYLPSHDITPKAICIWERKNECNITKLRHYMHITYMNDS